eukprot:2454005-Amphidinium_carterae.2
MQGYAAVEGHNETSQATDAFVQALSPCAIISTVVLWRAAPLKAVQVGPVGLEGFHYHTSQCEVKEPVWHSMEQLTSRLLTVRRCV